MVQTHKYIRIFCEEIISFVSGQAARTEQPRARGQAKEGGAVEEGVGDETGDGCRKYDTPVVNMICKCKYYTPVIHVTMRWMY